MATTIPYLINARLPGLPPQAPTASSFVQSVASEESYEESYPTARVLFDFTATSEFELGVSGALVLIPILACTCISDLDRTHRGYDCSGGGT